MQHADSVERLHRHPVLGSVSISSAETRTAIVQVIQHSVANWNRERYLCFDPRHCVRVIHGSQTFDFLTRYECHRIYIYRGEDQIASVGITDSPNTLNDILRASNVPLPEPIQLQ